MEGARWMQAEMGTARWAGRVYVRWMLRKRTMTAGLVQVPRDAVRCRLRRRVRDALCRARNAKAYKWL